MDTADSIIFRSISLCEFYLEAFMTYLILIHNLTHPSNHRGHELRTAPNISSSREDTLYCIRQKLKGEHKKKLWGWEQKSGLLEREQLWRRCARDQGSTSDEQMKAFKRFVLNWITMADNLRGFWQITVIVSRSQTLPPKGVRHDELKMSFSI